MARWLWFLEMPAVGSLLHRYPEPRNLDESHTKSGVPGFRYALIVIDLATLPGCRRKSGSGGNLLSVVELA